MDKETKKEAKMEGESAEYEAKEKKEGDVDDDDGVTVSEDYQRKAHEVTHKATRHHLNHLQSKMDDRRAELSKEEQKGKKEPSPKVQEYSADGGY